MNLLKNKRLIIGIVIVLVAVLIATFFAFSPKTQTVVSDDAKATLEIPRGALPEGVSASDIRINLVPEQQRGDFDLVYSLSPSGLVFSEAIVMSVRTPPNVTVPDVFHIIDGNSEIPEGIVVNIDASLENETEINIPLQHFSEVALDFHGRYKVEMVNPGDQVEGTDFFVPVEVRQNKKEALLSITPLSGGAYEDVRITVQQWSLDGEFRGENITPSHVKDRPPLTLVPGEKYDAGETFRCNKAGLKSTVRYSVDVHEVFTVQKVITGGEVGFSEETSEQKRGSRLLHVRADFNCLAAKESLEGVIGGDDGGGQSSGASEGTDDCFIPKIGQEECIIDVVGAAVERYPAANGCQGVRAEIKTDTDLSALAPQLQGEVVMQFHPKGQTNDGSADTGVGLGHYFGGKWTMFNFGQDGSKPAAGTFSAEIKEYSAVLGLDSFADGSCIADDSEMRVKLEMAEDPAGDRIYDILGFSGGLMEYHAIGDYLKVFGAK